LIPRLSLFRSALPNHSSLPKNLPLVCSLVPVVTMSEAGSSTTTTRPGWISNGVGRLCRSCEPEALAQDIRLVFVSQASRSPKNGPLRLQQTRIFRPTYFIYSSQPVRQSAHEPLYEPVLDTPLLFYDFTFHTIGTSNPGSPVFLQYADDQRVQVHL
jgi:hypothetical protein